MKFINNMLNPKAWESHQTAKKLGRMKPTATVGLCIYKTDLARMATQALPATFIGSG